MHRVRIGDLILNIAMHETVHITEDVVGRVEDIRCFLSLSGDMVAVFEVVQICAREEEGCAVVERGYRREESRTVVNIGRGGDEGWKTRSMSVWRWM